MYTFVVRDKAKFLVLTLTVTTAGLNCGGKAGVKAAILMPDGICSPIRFLNQPAGGQNNRDIAGEMLQLRESLS